MEQTFKVRCSEFMFILKDLLKDSLGKKRKCVCVLLTFTLPHFFSVLNPQALNRCIPSIFTSKMQDQDISDVTSVVSVKLHLG